MGEAGWASRFVGGQAAFLALAAVPISRCLSVPRLRCRNSERAADSAWGTFPA